jgi:hypothetical protein
MKKLTIRALLIAAAAVIAAAPAARAQVDVAVNVSIGGFYDELAPYGQWIDCSYGHCWVPARVAADWQPYTNGQWIYTQYGWTWVSDDPWGGNPYHYGTWVSIAGYGWSWVPGTVWAPAWVTWSYSNDYVGWAPLPPTVVFGASGYSGRPIVVRETQYVFVPTNRFVGGNVMAARIPAQQSAVIFHKTRPVTGFAVSGGVVRNTALPVTTIEHASGHRIEAASVQAARTSPHPAPAHWSVVAPAREVKAAVAARPQSANARNAPADHGNGNAKASKPPEASRIDQRPPSEAPAARRPEPQNEAAPARPAEGSAKQPVQKPKHSPADEKEKPEAQARHSAQPPAAHHSDSPQKPEPNAAEAAPKPKSHVDAEKPEAQANNHAPADAPAAHRPPPPPAQKAKPKPPKEKPVEKDQKPDGEKP